MPKSREKLSAKEIETGLKDLTGWTLKNGKLHRDYKFDDFVHAFSFMSACALHAQAMDHHPDWSNVWNKVTVDLNTHDVGGVTSLDLKLAGKMEAVAIKLGAK